MPSGAGVAGRTAPLRNDNNIQPTSFTKDDIRVISRHAPESVPSLPMLFNSMIWPSWRFWKVPATPNLLSQVDGTMSLAREPALLQYQGMLLVGDGKACLVEDTAQSSPHCLIGRGGASEPRQPKTPHAAQPPIHGIIWAQMVGILGMTGRVVSLTINSTGLPSGGVAGDCSSDILLDSLCSSYMGKRIFSITILTRSILVFPSCQPLVFLNSLTSRAFISSTMMG